MSTTTLDACTVLDDIICRALEGKLSLDELRTLWPQEQIEGSAWEPVFDRVEDAVEHWPHVDSRMEGELILDRLTIRLMAAKHDFTGLRESLSGMEPIQAAKILAQLK